MSDKGNGILKWSHDYRKFKLMEDRRPIDEKHVKELMESMEKRGYIAVLPIMVTPDGVVWDGNHRIMAAERLGIDYCYAIVDAVEGLDEAILLADTTKTWTTRDYLHRYCVQGNKNYLAVEKLLTDKPYLTIGTAIDLCSGRKMYSVDRSKSQIWRRGDFVAENVSFAYEVCDLIDYCKEMGVVPAYQQNFVRSIKNLMENSTFDEQVFRSKVKRAPYMITPQPRMDEYLQVISELYNYGTHAQNRVYFHKIHFNSKLHRRYQKRGKYLSED